MARNAPYTTPVRRLDEAGAAKRPVIRQAMSDLRPAHGRPVPWPVGMVIFSGIQPTGRKHLGNYIGAITAVRRRAGPRRPGDLLHRRPARDHRRLRPGRAARARPRHDGDADRRRARPRALHPLPPGRRARAHRAVLAALERHRGRRAQPHAPVPRQVGRRSASSSPPGCSSTRCCRPPTCSPTARTRCRSARTSASTSSSCATSPSASTPASARSCVVPEHRIPTVGARVRDLQEPERKMSTTGRQRAGHRLRARRARDGRQEVQARGRPTRAPTIVRADDKPGVTNLIEILAVVRDVTPEAIEREFAGPGYGDFKVAVGDAVVDWLAPVRERYAELRADADGARGAARRRRREGAGDRLGDARRRARGDGRRAPARPSAPRGAFRRLRRLAFAVVATAVRRLELDLDVFAGPVRPAAGAGPARGARPARGRARRGRARLPRPPAGARRARPRVRDRVPRPDRRAARAQVAADAAGRGGRGARGLEPAEAAEELLERMLAYARFHGGGRLAGRAPRRARRRALPQRAAARRAAARVAGRPPRRSTTRRGSARRSGGLLRTPPPLDLAPPRRAPRVSVAERLAVLRDLLRRRRLLLRGGGPRAPTA